MPIEIHGKEYTTVDERIVLLNELIENKQYSVVTKIEHLHFDSEDKGCIIMQAVLTLPTLNAGPFYGTAEEREASSQINKTSYVENCETSAVGRAFKHAHIWAGSEQGESANAMQQAIHQQDSNTDLPSSNKTKSISHTSIKEEPPKSNNKPINKHAGNCYRCQSVVAEGEGYIDKIDNKWKVFHHECEELF